MSQSKPDISIFLRSLAGGGAERLMVNLANNFAEEGFTVDLVLAKSGGPFVSTISPQVCVVDLDSPRLPASLPKLILYLRKKQPIALLSALHYPCEIALWAKQVAQVPTRVVVSEHNTLSVEAQNLPQLTAKLTPVSARLFYPWADRIVAVSLGVAQDLSQLTGISIDKIETIYNPVITPELFTQAREPADHPWFSSGESPVVLSVGRLEPQKDFPTLIRAFAQVRQICPARLMILGSGSEKQKLWGLIRELGLEQVIALPGFVPNPYTYMARAAVFALSSLWEGFGNVLVEAIALGTPVVATDCPHGPAEILNQGQYGDLVPPGNEQALAAAILKVLSGESRKTVDPNWLEQFTVEIASKKYLRVLGFTSTHK